MARITLNVRGERIVITTTEPYGCVKDRMYFRAPNLEVTNDATGRKVIVNKTCVVTVEEMEGEPEWYPEYGPRPYDPWSGRRE